MGYSQLLEDRLAAETEEGGWARTCRRAGGRIRDAVGRLNRIVRIESTEPSGALPPILDTERSAEQRDDDARSSPDARSGPPRFFYGWIVVAGAFLVLFMAYGTQYAFGVFFAALIEEFGWSRASLSGVFSLYAFIYAAFALVAGRLTDRWGPRAVIAIGGVLLGVGLDRDEPRERAVAALRLLRRSWPRWACPPPTCPATPPWRSGSRGAAASRSGWPARAAVSGPSRSPPVAHSW